MKLPRVLLAPVLVLATLASAAETIRVRADSWMPFNGDPASATPGYAVELLKAIFEPKGITIDYQIMPWADALKAANASEIEGVIGASKNEAAKLVIPQENISIARFGLFVKKASPWHYENIRSLEKIHLGAIDAYDYWEALNDYVKKHAAPQVTIFKGETPLKDAIAQLRADKIDVMPEALTVFAWEAKSEGLDIKDFRIAYIQEGDDVFVAFAPTEAGKKYAEIFDEGIRQLRKNGSLAKILNTYGLTDWK